MDPATLAGAAVGLLVALWTKASTTLAEKGGETLAQIVINKIKAKFSADTYSDGVLAGAEAAPEKPARVSNLEATLAEALAEDPDFYRDLHRAMVGEDPSAQSVVARDSGVVAGGDVTIRAGGDAVGRDKNVGRLG